MELIIFHILLGILLWKLITEIVAVKKTTKMHAAVNRAPNGTTNGIPSNRHTGLEVGRTTDLLDIDSNSRKTEK